MIRPGDQAEDRVALAFVRPTRVIHIEAGTVDTAVPRNIAVIGAVTHSGDGARMLPARPPMVITNLEQRLRRRQQEDLSAHWLHGCFFPVQDDHDATALPAAAHSGMPPSRRRALKPCTRRRDTASKDITQ